MDTIFFSDIADAPKLIEEMKEKAEFYLGHKNFSIKLTPDNPQFSEMQTIEVKK